MLYFHLFSSRFSSTIPLTREDFIVLLKIVDPDQLASDEAS